MGKFYSSSARARINFAICLLAAAAPCLQAEAAAKQLDSTTAHRAPVFDQEWAELNRFSAVDGSPLDSAGEAAQADRARGFYTQHPQDARVPEARRLEILHLINAVRLGDTTLEGRLDSTLEEFRRDATVPAGMRSEVAGSVDLPRAFRTGRSRAERLESMAQAARGLSAEFPTERQGYESLLTIARLSDDKRYLALLQELLALPTPKDFAGKVPGLLARQSLVGARFSDLLAQAGVAGGLAGLEPGKAAVLYTWDSRDAGSMQLARELAGRLHGRAALVAINLEGDSAAVRHAAEANQLPGFQVYDPAGGRSALAQGLMLTEPATVYVIDAAGLVRDVRTHDNLNTRLASLGL